MIEGQIQHNRSLSEFSTFGIGGPIRHFLEVTSLEAMQEAFSFARGKNLPVLIVGKGSNSLFPDGVFEGLAIQNKISFCDIDQTTVSVGAGYSFALLGIQTAKKHLAGLEFASGIPASVGGAIFMNAGANGFDTFQCLSSVTYCHLDGQVTTYPKEALEWGYRKTVFHRWQGAIISATFSLREEVNASLRQKSWVEQRIKTQPLKEKSIGCIFRNPSPDMPAGRLIEECGLKGYRRGGAEVSMVHANFIVNRGRAMASDVMALISHIERVVFEQKGIRLEVEVRFFSS